MHILFHFRTRGVGAEGVHIAGVAEAFRDLGHRVTFSSPTNVDPVASAGDDPFSVKKGGVLTPVARLAPKLLFEGMELAYNGVSLLRNARIIRDNKIDLIYERHAFFNCSTGLLARWAGVPLVLEVNELVGDERVRAQPSLSSVALATDRLVFSRADLVVVVSPYLKRRLIERGVAVDRIVVLPNAVVHQQVEVPADPAPVRARYQLDDQIVVGFVGFFVSWHRLERLIDAFAELCRDWPGRRLNLMLVGEGPMRDDLRERARSLGVADRVILTGAVSHDLVYQHIAAFDVAVIPFSNSFRSPIKLFEYMAQGRTVVAPATEPVRMVLREGENGVLFDPDDSGALKHALAHAIENPDLRQRWGAAARAQVLARHTWTRNAEETLRALGRPRSDQS